MNTKTKKLDDFINNLEPVNKENSGDTITDINAYLDDFIEKTLIELKITDYKDRLFAKDMLVTGFFQGLGLSEVGEDEYEDTCKDCQCCGNNSEDEE